MDLRHAAIFVFALMASLAQDIIGSATLDKLQNNKNQFKYDVLEELLSARHVAKIGLDKPADASPDVGFSTVNGTNNVPVENQERTFSSQKSVRDVTASGSQVSRKGISRQNGKTNNDSKLEAFKSRRRLFRRYIRAHVKRINKSLRKKAATTPIKELSDTESQSQKPQKDVSGVLTEKQSSQSVLPGVKPSTQQKTLTMSTEGSNYDQLHTIQSEKTAPETNNSKTIRRKANANDVSKPPISKDTTTYKKHKDLIDTWNKIRRRISSYVLPNVRRINKSRRKHSNTDSISPLKNDEKRVNKAFGRNGEGQSEERTQRGSTFSGRSETRDGHQRLRGQRDER